MFNKKVVSKLAARGAIYLMAGVLLLSMIAIPAMAVLAGRNTVDSAAIIDHTIQSRDIKNGAVTKDRIANGAVTTNKIAAGAIKRGKIANDAVRSYHINDGAVWSSNIQNGTIVNADISTLAGISDSKISFSTRTGYLSIPAAAMAETTSGQDYTRGRVIRAVVGTDTVFRAPVFLLNGAVVTEFRYYALDDLVTGDTSASLFMVNNLQTMAGTMASAGTTTESATYQELTDTTVNTPTIDNNAYAYYVRVTLGSASTSLAASNIIIKYTYTP